MPSATSIPLVNLPQLPLPPAGDVIASPDGTRLAVLNPSLSTVTLYDSAGTVYGQYHDPAGGRLGVWWLANSSGICITSDHPPFNMRIMDRAGTVHPTAFDDIYNPLLSPDGQWIAGTLGSSTSTQDVVEIGSRNGATVRRLPPGSDFLGWLDGELAYVANGTISLVSPAGGAARTIAQVPPENVPREVPGLTDSGAMVTSPDDQVLIVVVFQNNVPNDWRLTSAGLTQLPIHVILPGFWVGAHAALGAIGSTSAVEVLDLLTGATIQKTAAQLDGNELEVVSGNWIAAIAGLPSAQLLLINYQTGASRDLGNLPPSPTIVPLGTQGQFLVNSLNGPTYLASAT